MKMTVVYVKDTGQVMAAVTRAALAEAAPAAVVDGASPEVLALVGDSLPVRSFLDQGTGFLNPTLFSIPADQLAALTVDRDEVQLLSPRGFTVLDGKKLEVALPPAALPGVTTPVGDPSAVVVTLPADAVSDLPLALHLVPKAGAAGGSQHFQGVFKQATPPVRVLTFRLSAPLKGDYGVLILLKGYLPAMQLLTV